MTAADTDKIAMDTTLACLRGYADCVEGAVEKGIVCAPGVYDMGQVQNTEAMRLAYEFGLGV